MGKWVGVIAGALALTVASTALAASRALPQDGVVFEDRNASVSLVVVKSDGAAKTVKNIRFDDLRMKCGSGRERIDLTLSGKAKPDADGEFTKLYRDGRSKVFVEGKVKRQGRRVVGDVTGSFVRTNAGKCRVPDVSFRTNR